MAVIAALTGAERQRRRSRLLLPGQVDEEFRAALARNDHAALCRSYRQALSLELPPRDEQLIRINLACALNGMKRYAQSLDELDRVDLKHLSSSQAALWLNNRAYTLTLLGKPEDALSHLGDAEDLLIGEDGKDPMLAACIAGTRGIALYHKGDFDDAEQALQLALRLEEDLVAHPPGIDADLLANPARTAERWWWLSQIAEARGDPLESRVRLQRAAVHPMTEFGSRALSVLRGDAAPPAS